MNAKTRAEVKERDKHRCRICGTGGSLHVHHIVFRSHGGPDELWNLISLCQHHHNAAHGLIRGEKITKWELHAAALGFQACLTCQYRAYDGCEIWEHPVDWDYVCEAWRFRDT